jgi:RNA polymerase sigma-32 factor
VLSPERERELALRAKAGDHEAKRRLVEGCLAFVVTIALEYRRWGLPLEDLVQEGNLGLLEAVERFDPERGCRLATYAVYWIRAEIRAYLARGYRIVCFVSRAEQRAVHAYRRTQEKDPAVIAAMSGLTPERAAQVLAVVTASDVSLDGSPGDDWRAPIERLAAGAPSPEDEASLADERDELHAAVEQVLAGLSPREQRIARQRWMADEPATLEQLGLTFGVSKERVRQIEEGARKRVRERLTRSVGEPAARACR